MGGTIFLQENAILSLVDKGGEMKLPLLEMKAKDLKKWESEYNRLIESPRGKWLKKKTDRRRRLREISTFIDKYCPEIRTGFGSLIDVGCGPGELMEIARYHGHDTWGIDAISGNGGMGDEYLSMCKLLTKRQGLRVDYIGCRGWNINWESRNNPAAHLIVCRGAIEQIMHESMDGVPHDIHHNCMAMSWQETNETVDRLVDFCSKARICGRPNGHLLIHANGARNTGWYDEAIVRAARESGFQLVMRDGERLHQFRLVL